MHTVEIVSNNHGLGACSLKHRSMSAVASNITYTSRYPALICVTRLVTPSGTEKGIVSCTGVKVHASFIGNAGIGASGGGGSSTTTGAAEPDSAAHDTDSMSSHSVGWVKPGAGPNEQSASEMWSTTQSM